MTDPALSRTAVAMPAHCIAVPIDAANAAASLRICAVLSVGDDGAAPVGLHADVDSRIILGALVDADDRVLDWLELWYQDLAGLGTAAESARHVLDNRVLDARWAQRSRAARDVASDEVMLTGFEDHSPPPTWLDPDGKTPIHPTDDSGSAWSLCTDDALLARCDLPAYSTSTHRYLVASTDTPRLAATTPDCPRNDHTCELSDVIAAAPNALPLNPAAGRIMVRRRAPLNLEHAVDIIGGRPLEDHTDAAAPDTAVIESIANAAHSAEPMGGWLLNSRADASTRLIEVLHLKLGLLRDVVSAVADATAALDRPFLNLTARSFRVRVPDARGRLPWLWMARAIPVEPGDAVQWSVPGSSVTWYLPSRTGQASVYQPLAATREVSGKGDVRVRDVSDTDGAVVIEGTLATQDLRDGETGTNPGDLLWLRLAPGAARIDLPARIVSDAAMAPGEYRFRSLEVALDADALAAVKQVAGVSIPDTRFDVVPLLSSPADLYAVAVIMIRALLVSRETTLATAVDAVMSLARQVSELHDPAIDLRDRVRSVIAGDARWSKSLGPQHLMHDALDAAGENEGATGDLVPPALWAAVLAAIVRCLPGVGPDSICADLGTPPHSAPASAYAPAIEALDDLLRHTRSLVAVDWSANRELHDVIRLAMSR